VSALEILVVVLQWVITVFLVAASLVVLVGVLLGMWRGVRKWFTPVKGKGIDSYMAEAMEVGKRTYKDEIIMPNELVQAFNRGARWGWGYQHRK